MARYANVTTVLGSAVATSGTFTVSYPAGTSRGDFLFGRDHRMVAAGVERIAPKDFTISFGTGSATITHLGASTLPAGTTVRVQLDRPGRLPALPSGLAGIGSAAEAQPFLIHLGSPIAASTTALINAATSTELPNAGTKTYTFPVSASASPQDGANLTGALDVPRNLVLTTTHGSSIVAAEVRVWGYDKYQVAMYEVLAVTATGTSKTVAGKKAFARLTRVDIYSAGDATTNTMSLGFGDVLGLPMFVPAAAHILAEFEDLTPVVRGDVVVNINIAQTPLLAPTAQSVVAPVSGTVTAIHAVTTTAVGTGGTLTAAINGTNITGGQVTVANSAAIGDNDIAIPTAANTVVAGDTITITPASFASTGAERVAIHIAPTSASAGTLVAGSTATPTSTTGDVRGTYDPASACDGSKGFTLVAWLPDPQYLGAPQYTL